MPPLPPEKDVLDALRLVVLPSAGGAALAAATLLALGRWAAPLASAAGVAAGFACAVWMKPDDLIPWTPDPARTWQLLPRAAAVLLLVGLVTHAAAALITRHRPDAPARRVAMLVWCLRIGAVGVVTWRLVPVAARTEVPWLLPAFAVVVLALWVALDSLTRTETNGLTVGLSAAAMLGAGGVMLYSHSAQFMEIATAVAAVLAGVAVVSAVGKVSAGGAVPAVAVFLPGLLLTGRLVNDSKVPVASFWLLALAPLALAIFLVPAIAKRNPRALAAAKVALVLAPVVVAVVLAGRVETLPWEQEW